jgi:hypothetical protein
VRITLLSPVCLPVPAPRHPLSSKFKVSDSRLALNLEPAPLNSGARGASACLFRRPASSRLRILAPYGPMRKASGATVCAAASCAPLTRFGMQSEEDERLPVLLNPRSTILCDASSLGDCAVSHVEDAGLVHAAVALDVTHVSRIGRAKPTPAGWMAQRSAHHRAVSRNCRGARDCATPPGSRCWAATPARATLSTEDRDDES